MATGQSQSDQDLLLQRQVKELYGNSHASSLAVVVISTFLTWILWQVTDQMMLLVWFIFTQVLTAFRTLLAVRRKNSEQRSLRARFWLKSYIAGVFLSGLGWGSVLLFLVPVEATYYLICTLLLICGLVTGSAGTLASLKYGFATFAMPALLPSAFYLILLNQQDTLFIGVSICIFLVFISVIALRIHSIILYSIKKQFESAKLVVEIKEINQELTSQYDHLEKKLQHSSRTIRELQEKLVKKSDASLRIAEVKYLLVKDDKFKFLLDKLHGGLWDLNLKTGDIYYNQQWLKMLYFREGEYYCTTDFWKSLIHPQDKAEVLQRLDALAKGKTVDFVSSHRMKTRDGQWVWIFSRGQAVAWDQYGETINIVCADINIADPEIHWRGKADSTQFNASEWLYPEADFSQRLQYALQTTAIDNIEHALCHIAFYRNNSTQAASSELESCIAVQAGNILVKTCMQNGAVANTGTDTFLVLLENCTLAQAQEKARALQALFSKQQFLHNEQEIQISSCIGITPITRAHGDVPETLDDAVAACSIAREEADGSVYVYKRGNEEFDPDVRERRRQAKILAVLENKRLQLAIIPLKLLATLTDFSTKIFWLDARLPGFLHYPSGSLRLQTQESGNSLAIACDLCTIAMFYDWSIAQPATYTRQNNTYILECSESSILDSGFLDKLRSDVANKNSPRHQLCLGITEDTYIAHGDSVRKLIETLQPLGYSFALTGFGSSNISFEYMKSLPVDYLKLDDALIKNVDTDQTALLTVKYLNDISHVLKFKTIATGADSEVHLEKLRDIGTDYIQGFESGQPRLLTPGSHLTQVLQ